MLVTRQAGILDLVNDEVGAESDASIHIQTVNIAHSKLIHQLLVVSDCCSAKRDICTGWVPSKSCINPMRTPARASLHKHCPTTRSTLKQALHDSFKPTLDVFSGPRTNNTDDDEKNIDETSTSRKL